MFAIIIIICCKSSKGSSVHRYKFSVIPTLVAIASTITASLFTVSAHAAFDQGIRDGVESARTEEMMTNLVGAQGVFSTVTDVLLFVIGAISVIMIIIGGIRYVISGGDSAKVTAAKNTILYAIVGIIVALLAYAIINFVLVNFSAGEGAGAGTDI